MKIAQRFLQYFLAFFLLAGCVSSPAAETATGQAATLPPASTVTLSPTQTLTVLPTATPPPTPTHPPLPTIPPVQPVIGLPQGTDNYPWWNDTVFYEIFVRSFYDSNNDGIGDFNGLTAKLDYLNDGDPNTTTDLGVTGLWLMPINPSPSYHGYDVSDYYAVNPQYGTMDDFKHLLAEAHKRGIRIVIDWVLNHTSARNSWFQQAQDPASPYRQWYRWSADRPTTPGWYPGGGNEYYYAFFDVGMPDLNYRNPKVVAEMKNVAKFWLKDVGVDGFRLDAVKYIVEDGSTVQNTPETHAWYKKLRTFYEGVNPQALTVGEVWDNSEVVNTYLAGDELDLAFDFDLARNLVFTAGSHRAKDMTDVLNHDLQLFRPGQFATFLTNHDQDRVMSVLNDDLDAAKNAAMLLLTSPGVPFLYYGEEIGMLGKKPDENIRLPMQWSGDANGGFTTGTPWRAPNVDYTTKNVVAQSSDANSLLSLYRTLIGLRSSHAALRVGDFYLIDSGNRAVSASLRVSREETVLVIVNLGSEPVSNYVLKLDQGPLSASYSVASLLGEGEFSAPQITDKGGFNNYQPLPELPPYGKFILQLQEKKK
ncbi:MAG: alpha-amylase family glycosyl hydrolase [Anaerolineales bacterium]